MFSMVTVASSTRMPTASASPPSVMMLMVSCRELSTMIEVRMESGIETAMIKRAAPAAEEDQDHQARQAGGNDGFANHAVDGSPHEDGLIGQRV